MSSKKKENKSSGRIVWADCEMTGLNPEVDALIEVAVVVTDSNLNVLDGGIDVLIKPPAAALKQMSDFVRNMHTSSGLLAEIDEGGLTMAEATTAIVDYIKNWVPDAEDAPLAGNSIGMDKLFLSANMPELISHLHYRVIDVSTLKELARRWYDRVWQCAPAKAEGHRALADIIESIDELRYYRQAMLVPPPGPSSTDLKEIAAQIKATSGGSAQDLY